MLDQFSDDRGLAVGMYREFVLEGLATAPPLPYELPRGFSI